VNRDALKAWLDQPTKTWRWNSGEVGGYHAVEARGDSLRWYTWSHDADGSVQNEVQQSAEAFTRDGAPTNAPAPVIEALRAHFRKEHA
jgi:hypothetical protein